MDLDDNKYYLQVEELIDDKDSDYNYEVVPYDEFDEHDIDEDDFQNALRILQDADFDEQLKGKQETIGKKFDGTAEPVLIEKPPSIEDFILTFLMNNGMQRTLNSFQIERFELRLKGSLHNVDKLLVPDVYVENLELNDSLKIIRDERDKYKLAAIKAKEMYIKLRNERDYHKLQHRRLAQEKNKLLNDAKKIKEHFSSYQPLLQTLQTKYETAMKEKMLNQLERDRALGKVNNLKSMLRGLEEQRQQVKTTRSQTIAPESDSLELCPTKEFAQDPKKKFDVNQGGTYQPHYRDTIISKEDGFNPMLGKVRPLAVHLTRSGGFRLAATANANESSVSCVCLHPTRAEVCSTADDGSWSLWSLPSMELITNTKGHSSWIGWCEFSPDGQLLATCGSDNLIKLWCMKTPTTQSDNDISSGHSMGKDMTLLEILNGNPSYGRCLQTFQSHGQSIWSVSWHESGNLLASGSQDGTIKLWDLQSERCRLTMRGNQRFSINAVQFLRYSNILLSTSADHTISLWDVRTGTRGQNLLGHEHAVNHASFNVTGDSIVSCDSFGFVKFWDLRTIGRGGNTTQQLHMAYQTCDLGPHQANTCFYDISGSCVVVASHDGLIRVVEINNFEISAVDGHEDAVTCCRIDDSGELMVSAGADNTVRLWS